MGHEISFSYPTRIFTVENEGKVLVINGARHRLGVSSDGGFGLSAEQIRKCKELKGSKALSQRDYFRLIDRKPLLVIYFVQLKENDDEKQNNEDIKNQVIRFESIPAVGFSVGIPKLTDQETKYARYILNKVAIQQIFEGEFEDYEDDEVD